jgi:hypothetical protein
MAIPLIVYLVAVIGIAGFGHVFLDIFDVEEDRLLGKSNLWAPLTGVRRVGLVAVLLAASLLPWTVLPLNRIGVLLVALEFVMFLMYAVPPIRLKSRGFPGIAADSMYAHTRPALWTWIPFSILAGSAVSRWFPVALAIWTFTVGVRHLLQHQVIQLESDATAGALTHAVRRGRESTLRLIVGRVLPIEVAAFSFLLGIMAANMMLIPVTFLIYALWQLSKFRFLWLSRLSLAASPDADRATVAGTLVMTRFYERWLPVLVLLLLSVRTPAYTVLLMVHLILFRTAFGDILDDITLAASHSRSSRRRVAVD